MSAEQAVERRLARRETHSPRAGAAIVLALLLAVLLLALGAGCVALLAGRPGATPPQRLGLPAFETARPMLVVAGVVGVVVGVLLLVAALAPGRRRRRRLDWERMVVLIDDRVIADEIADRVRAAFTLQRRQVRVLVARRRATVRIVPTSGVRLEAAAVERLADEVARGLGVAGGARVQIAEQGVVSP